MDAFVRNLSTATIVEDNRPLRELGDLKIDLTGFSEGKLQDLVERLKLGDLEGFCQLTKTSKNNALLAMRAFYERSSSGQTVRRMLRTPDARRLAKDILALFSEEASSPVAREGIALLDQRQELPRDLLRQNFENWMVGKRLLEEVEARGRLERLRSLLS